MQIRIKKLSDSIITKKFPRIFPQMSRPQLAHKKYTHKIIEISIFYRDIILEKVEFHVIFHHQWQPNKRQKKNNIKMHPIFFYVNTKKNLSVKWNSSAYK